MSSLRLLASGEWNKDPVLVAARRLVFSALREEFEPMLLGDVATFLNGTSYDKAHVHADGELPVIRISNISDPSSQYVRTDEVLPDRFLVAAGDLLVSWSASFKSIIWPGPAGWLNQHIFKVTEKYGFDRHFIRHAIEASFEKMQEGVVGIGMMHLRRDAFLSNPIPGIPIALQRHVAKYLDAVEKREPRPEHPSHESLAKAMKVVERIEAIVGRIDEARRLRGEADKEAASLTASAANGIFEPLIAEGKATRPLGDLADIVSGVTLGRRLSGRTVTLPYLRVANVQDGHLELTHIKAVDVLPHEEMKWRLELGDLLLTEGGDWDKLGRGCLWNGEIQNCIHQNHIFRVRVVDQSVLPEFLSAIVGSPTGKAYFQAASKQTTNLASINQRQLKAFPVPVLPMAQQRAIVAELHAVAACVARLRHEQGDTGLERVVPTLLDKAFRGEM